MAKFFTESRMVSQFNKGDVFSVVYQASGADAAVTDGTLAVMGDFYTDPVYSAAFTSATGSPVTKIDINTRVATLPASATDKQVGVINLVSVPKASGVDNTTYNEGIETLGLSALAGTPVRFRRFYLRDTFFTGADNFTSAPTVGQYAIVDTTGNWAPSATIPTSGLTAKVQSNSVASRGVTPDVNQYFMEIVQL